MYVATVVCNHMWYYNVMSHISEKLYSDEALEMAAFVTCPFTEEIFYHIQMCLYMCAVSNAPPINAYVIKPV